MADYSREHASALRAMQRKGSPITFPALSGGTYNASTGTWSSTTGGAAVSGYAVEKPLDPEEYRPDTQIISSDALLVFIPSTYGAFPVTGQAPTWAGKKRTVKQVWPIRPAEVAIAARVVLG